MDRWVAWDVAWFRWINRDLAHPWLDPVMKFLSGNPLFGPGLVLLAVGLVWRGGRRGIVFVIMLGAAAALANEFLAEPLKDWCRRPRPYVTVEDAILRVGRGNPTGSMPSAHAMNSALMATMAVWFYRRSAWVVIPLAFGVGYSRVYNGVHYPGDVLTGFALGTAFGLGFLWGMDQLWRRFGPRWFPGLIRRLPSLSRPTMGGADEGKPDRRSEGA